MKCPNCRHENPSDTRFCGQCGNRLYPYKEISDSPTDTLQTPMVQMTRGKLFAQRYEIIEELGKGGMGRVYKVFDKEIKEEVALKLLKPEIAADERTLERFRNELKNARKISHRNVCRMYDLNEFEGANFITMEYVAGEDLQTTITKMGPLSTAQAISITRQVCEGLAEAHRLDIIHRDIKPQNIMIDKKGHVRIMDFGIARMKKTREITGSGLTIGTPDYMSPEQVEGKTVDHRSDIYSLGAVLFEMMTGRVLFEGDTPLGIALKHKIEPPPDPRELNPQIPESIGGVILACLEKDREKRYQSTTELLADLDEIESKIPTRERFRPLKSTRARKLRKGYSLWKAAGIFLAGAAVLLGGYFLVDRIILSRKQSFVQLGLTEKKHAIAVLPVEDLSPEKDQGHICEGMLDDIITKLSSSPELRVVPKRSVIRYKDTGQDIVNIGRRLKVDSILDTSLQIEQDRIRINAKLSSTKDGFHIWSDTYQTEIESYFQVQDEISSTIAEKLEVHLVPEKYQALKTREPESIEAYKFLQLGKHFSRNYVDHRRPEDFEEALRLLNAALEIDPNYALAFYELGDLYDLHYVYTKDKSHLDLMLQNYEKAYTIDPDLPETNIGLGWAYFFKEDLDSAYHYFKEAYQLAPDSLVANAGAGSFLRSIGLHKEAIPFYEKAITISPLTLSNYRLLGSCFAFLGEYRKGVNVANQAIDLGIEHESFDFYLNATRNLIFMKRYEEAEEELQKAAAIEPGDPGPEYLRVWIYAARGEKDKALAIIDGLEPYYFTYLLSTAYAILDMKDEAIAVIKDGMENGFYQVFDYLYSYLYLRSNPYFDSLKDDPRFQDLFIKAKNIYENRVDKYAKF
ncbi:MAG: protein kinase [Candidatus Aminicenantes bacterium]|jgi:serine/threonine protein kinase